MNLEIKALEYAEEAEKLFKARRYLNENDKNFLLSLAEVYSNLAVAAELRKIK